MLSVEADLVAKETRAHEQPDAVGAPGTLARADGENAVAAGAAFLSLWASRSTYLDPGGRGCLRVLDDHISSSKLVSLSRLRGPLALDHPTRPADTHGQCI